MKITYSDHAKKKFKFLKELGWNFKRKVIKNVLDNPTKTGKGYLDRKIAIGKIDETHNLLVVYDKERDIITVVTFYPVKKGRYDKK